MSIRTHARLPARTGASDAARARGFTLIELLVVLVIIGLAGSAVLLTLPAENARLRQDAARLAGRIGLARDEAILGLSTVELVASAGGSRLRRQVGAQWHALDGQRVREQRWSDAVSLQLPPGQAQLTLRFDPTGMTEPRQLQLQGPAGQIRLDVAMDGQVVLHERRH